MCVLLLAFCRGMFFVSNVHTVSLSQDETPLVLQASHERGRVLLEIPVSNSVVDGQYWYLNSRLCKVIGRDWNCSMEKFISATELIRSSNLRHPSLFHALLVVVGMQA